MVTNRVSAVVTSAATEVSVVSDVKLYLWIVKPPLKHVMKWNKRLLRG